MRGGLLHHLAADAHTGDSTALRLEHLDPQPVHVDLLPHRRHTAEVRKQEAANRSEPFGWNADAQTIVQIGIELPGLITLANLQAGIAYALERRGLGIQPLIGRARGAM